MKKLSRITIMMVVALTIVLTSCTEEKVNPSGNDKASDGQHGGY